MAKKDPMAELPGGHLTLEQASQVIRAHRDAEAREQRKVAEQYIGKFYRYRNRYGGDDKGWWLYVAVTDAHDGGSVGGWDFQATTSGELQARFQKYFWVDRGGYNEIPARTFWSEWEKFKAKMASVPKPGARATLRRRRSPNGGSE